MLMELKKYCEEKEPRGVVLLTGEWGCGKTYFIEHDLQDAIKEKAAILRVSLFGITSQDEVSNAIKQTWLNERIKGKKWGEITRIVKNGLGNIAGKGWLPEEVEDIVSIDVKTLIFDTHKMKNKKVVLVFDDLERCTMNSAVVLGMINDYSEKEKYPIIIVANESKIKDSEDEISYYNIKEKVVSRTIEYVPDYRSLVDSIIENTITNSEYRFFLKNHSKKIQEIFAPESITESSGDRAHNLRSLKSALIGFDRIYDFLWKKGISNIDSFFDAFLQYVLAYKMGRTKVSEIRELYPKFRVGYMMNSTIQWIEKGVWDEDALLKECENIRVKNNSYDLEQNLAFNSILDLNQEITEQEFEKYLNRAYAGELYADGYVLFVENSSLFRQCGYKFPEINWAKVEEGIRKQVEIIINNYGLDSILMHDISDGNREYLTQKEKNVYELICREFALDNLRSRINQKIYVQQMEKPGDFYLKDLKMNVFDENVAASTFEGFKRADNREKNSFIEIFRECWENNKQNKEFDKECSKIGLEKLSEQLQGLLAETVNRQTAYHINSLLSVVEQLKDSDTCRR